MNHTGIPVGRILEKLDDYLEHKDFPAAERLLRNWEAEAEAVGDLRGLLAVCNEQIGFYRKTEHRDDAFSACEKALQFAEEAGFAESVTMGTTLVNAATAYKAFGRSMEAVALYQKVEELYLKYLPENDSRMGGLYNNMALAVMEQKEYAKAEMLFYKALAAEEQIPDSEADRAITYCNMADLKATEPGQEKAEAEIRNYLESAMALLDTPTLPRNGYYAYVCEKCAPVFGFYGYFVYEQVLKARAEEYYERA